MASSEEPQVFNWDRVIHKGVRTSDGVPAGYIAADDADSIVILGPRTRQYRIPKSAVTYFDGSEVRVSVSIQELREYLQ
ncbi:MAG TPA: hypothetical protein VJP79_07275 [Nitrososphaera sp.]|nr:hypothetical protein [Nitrososphaera sp.]